jgi:hypothetical protein
METKVTAEDSEEEAKNKVKQRKELYAKIRKERGDCEDCLECEKKFCHKLIEYLWVRENKKNGLDPFERLLSAIRHVDERAADTWE